MPMLTCYNNAILYAYACMILCSVIMLVCYYALYVIIFVYVNMMFLEVYKTLIIDDISSSPTSMDVFSWVVLYKK